MKPFWVGALVLMGLVLGAGELGANITPVNYPTPMPAGMSYSGVITNLDPVNLMIQLREVSGMVQTIRVDDRTTILSNNSVVSFNSLSLGDTVTVTSR